MHFPGSKDKETKPADEVQWIPYRENGEVKYMRSDDPAAQDFNSVGGSAKHEKVSGYSNMPGGGFVANNPNLLPERYTDDSVIAVIVTGVVPSEKKPVEEKKGFLSKLKPSKSPETTKAVWMPRSEYKKFFAKDRDGNYIGTEPQREWTEEELEDEFGQYHKELPKVKKSWEPTIMC